MRDFKIEKKHFGVIFEKSSSGIIENITAINNFQGIYVWDGDNNIIQKNKSNDNIHSGIFLDGDQSTNSLNFISENEATGNGQMGLMLWLDWPNTTITNNIFKNNNNAGIGFGNAVNEFNPLLPLGYSNNSVVSGNTVNNNTNGLHINRSNHNEICANIIEGNLNVGVWLEISHENSLQQNQVNSSQSGSGIWLTSSTQNNIMGNTCSENSGNGINLTADSTGNIITGNSANGNDNMGIVIDKGSDGNTLSDNTSSRNPNGVLLMQSDGNTVEGNTIDGSANAGIWLVSANDNTFSGNRITNNATAGVWLKQSNNNLFYNNYLNNISNATFEITNTGNIWNIQKISGRNVMSGPFMGGNFWGKTNGEGFSQVTPDSNLDGFCDSPYTVSTGNVDQLPLHEYVQPTEAYVNPNDITCGGNYPCFSSIQDAINASNSGKTIKLVQGTYNETYILTGDKVLSIQGDWDPSFSQQVPGTTLILPPAAVTNGSLKYLDVKMSGNIE